MPTSSEPARTTRRPWLTSLRARLIASHSFVLLLALALVLGISAFWLRRYERESETDRLKDLAVPLMLEISTISGQGGAASLPRTVAALLQYQATEMEVRLLVIGVDGVVRFDSADLLIGQELTAYTRTITAVFDEAQRRANDNRARGSRVVREVAEPARRAADDPLDGQILVVAAGGQPPLAHAVLGIVAPERSQPIRDGMLPPLLLTVAISLAVASLAGYLLSRRLAAPVARLTDAADAMAAGTLDQHVEGEGPDELGRLVTSFNTMSHQVATTARSQRDLLANIAHELRTPLTSVQGYTQALRDGLLDDPAEQERALATIGGESQRMANLIQQLLELARLESGQTRWTPRPVEVAPLLARVADRFGPEAERRSVTIAADAPVGLQVMGDEERLGQIVGNLVSNALRHTPAGGQVTMTGAPFASAGDSGVAAVRLTVRDTGEGIAPERLPRIFDRFERGEGHRDGFGLGLAIVRELVQAHGGTISVASQLGVGTTFAVDLPAGV